MTKEELALVLDVLRGCQPFYFDDGVKECELCDQQEYMPGREIIHAEDCGWLNAIQILEDEQRRMTEDV